MEFIWVILLLAILRFFRFLTRSNHTPVIRFLIHVFRLNRFIYKLKVIIYLLKHLPHCFQGSEIKPLPKNVLERLKLYVDCLFKLYRLYQFLVDRSRDKK